MSWNSSARKQSILSSLPTSEAQLALFEESSQGWEVIISGAQRNRVNIVSAEDMTDFRAPGLSGFVKPNPGSTITGIDFNLLASLGIFERDDANIRESLLALVVDPDRDEIVPSACDR